MTLLLSTDDTAQLVPTSDGIDVLEKAYQALHDQDAAVRLRSDLIVPLGAYEGYDLATMEGAIRSMGVAAVVLRSDRNTSTFENGTYYQEKYAQKLGLFCGLTILYSLETAEPLAIINHGHLQVMRVGAASAIAAKRLARSDSKVLGIIGAGWQARGHARAYAASFPLELVKVYSRGPEALRKFCQEMEAELGLPFVGVGSPRETVEGSDIVAACTDSKVKVVEDNWFAPGMFLSCVRGSWEVGHDGMSHADIYGVHSRDFGVINRVREMRDGDWVPGVPGVMELPERAVSLAQIVGDAANHRSSNEQINYFNNNRGLGIQFAALGKLAYDRAVDAGIGRELPTDWFLMNIST